MENYVGKRLDGRYEIMEIIGVGGMAVVYKAFDNIDHRIVAIKILKQEYLSNDEFKRRFKNESKAIAVLSHDNIVKVFDVSFGDVIQYIVMEYVDGITLKEYIKQQRAVNIREALYFITQILSALQHAHDKGIVHRDIKPQNIMLISDGTIKVTDFGIARFSQNETRTMTEGAIGSVHYISPEQAKGSVTDAKTDIYSCGVMLYEMLTGKLPFQSDNAVSVALMQLQKDPVRPREINPNIPVGLEEIIIKAMQKNQSSRYQSASEMLGDIREFIKNPSVVFGYTYEPVPVPVTDFGEKTAATSGFKPITPEPATETTPAYNDDFDYEDFDVDVKNKTKTIAILGSVLAALVIFGIVLAVMFIPDKNKIDVPNLVGLNFYDQVLNKSEYENFVFEPVVDNESNEERGTILDQNPSHGKIEIGGTITLYVSGAGSRTEVPDVYGYEAVSAEKLLKSKGFDVKIIKETSDQNAGTVIRTSPGKNQTAETGSTIEIYVATNEELEPVDVPNLIGMTVSEAKKALEDVGLYFDSARSENRSSSEPKGTIIGYEKIGEKVLPGTSIAVYVSSGKVVESTEESTTEETTTKQDNTTTTKKKVTTVPSTETTTKPTQSTEPSTTETTTTTALPTTTTTTTQVQATTEPSSEASEPSYADEGEAD